MNANPTAGGRENLNAPIIFTRQECKVLDYARKLMTNQEIADKLDVCELTIAVRLRF
jgi:DNA-binding NarL/FixJ family response regulator